MMDACLVSMPQVPLNIDGELIVRRRRGVELHRLNLHVDLRWGATPPEASYTLRDEDTGATEYLRLVRPAGQPVQISFAVNGHTAALPQDRPLAGTDIGWADLTFDFLWWRGGRKVGTDSIKGRACTILELPAPTNRPSPYATVKVWMDDTMMGMIKAEGFDSDGRLVRSLWVSGLKEVDDRWMISEMEVQQHPVRHRTKVRIQEVSEQTP